MFIEGAAKSQNAVLNGRINWVTINAGMIIVYCMFNSKINFECYDHDPQTIHKKNTDNFIAKHVGFKPYA